MLPNTGFPLLSCQHRCRRQILVGHYIEAVAFNILDRDLKANQRIFVELESHTPCPGLASLLK
jgi:hypothetical protein